MIGISACTSSDGKWRNNIYFEVVYNQTFKFYVVSHSLGEAEIINTSYQKLPFGSGDDPDKLFFHRALNQVSNSSDRELPRDMFRLKTV